MLSLITPTPKTVENPKKVVEKAVESIKSVATREELFGDCIPHSLVLWHLLAKHGIDAAIRLGVSKLHGFHAHSWVEYDGYALMEGDEVHHRYHQIEGFRLQRNSNK